MSYEHQLGPTTPKRITLRVPAERYEDHDNCLAAAEADISAERGLVGWDLNPRWDGGDEGSREAILLDVPVESPAED